MLNHVVEKKIFFKEYNEKLTMYDFEKLWFWSHWVISYMRTDISWCCEKIFW